jgi:hypothetical protein
MKQKAKVLTLILVGLLFTNLSAQEDNFKNDPVAPQGEDQSFRLGLQLSPQISWLSPNSKEYKNDGSRFGVAYGLATEFFLAKNYLLSTGFMISSLGGNVAYEGVFEDNDGVNIVSGVEQSYAIKYIEIPLTLKLRTNQIGYMTYYGNFGFKSGVKFQSTSDFTYTDINNKPKVEGVNTAGDIFFFNMYLTVGAGVEYNLSGNTNVMVGITYNNGFINQLNKKLNIINEEGKAELNNLGQPNLSEKNASANLKYIALNIGLFF